MKSVCVVVLVGLPGSGKTSLTVQLKDVLVKRDSVHVSCFSFDDILPLDLQASIALSTVEETTKEYRMLMRRQIESCVESFQEGTLIIIIDDNNYYRSMRYTYYQLATKHKAGYLQVYLKCPTMFAIKRNNQRPSQQRVPECVIHSMASRLQEPCEKWEKFFTLDCLQFEDQALQSLVSTISAESSNPVMLMTESEDRTRQAEADRLANSSSFRQKVDLIMRKNISLAIKQSSGAKCEISVLAKRLNESRQVIMRGIQLGTLWIPEGVGEDCDSIEQWVTPLLHESMAIN